MPQEAHHIHSVLSPPIVAIARYASEHASTNRQLISFGQGLPFFGPPQFALDQLGPKLNSSASALHRYSPDEGLAELREELLLHHRQEVPNLQGGVLVTAGANQAIFTTLATILNPGDEVLVPTPYYFNSVMAVQILRAKPVFVPRQPNFDLDIPALEAAVNDRTKAVIITSPDNPTGAVYPRRSMELVYDLAVKHDLWLLHDETYRDFLFAENSRHFSATALEPELERVVGLYSFSKAYGMAGHRLGYCLYPQSLAESLVKVQDTLVVCPPVPAQHLALTLLRQNQTQSWLVDQLLELAKVRSFVLRELASLGSLSLPDDSLSGHGGFYVFPELTSDRFASADEFVKALIREEGVVFLPGDAFGPHWGGHVRLAFGNVSMEQAQEGFARMNRFFL